VVHGKNELIEAVLLRGMGV
jgi:hypothetical protein